MATRRRQKAGESWRKRILAHEESPAACTLPRDNAWWESSRSWPVSGLTRQSCRLPTTTVAVAYWHAQKGLPLQGQYRHFTCFPFNLSHDKHQDGAYANRSSDWILGKGVMSGWDC